MGFYGWKPSAWGATNLSCCRHLVAIKHGAGLKKDSFGMTSLFTREALYGWRKISLALFAYSNQTGDYGLAKLVFHPIINETNARTNILFLPLQMEPADQSLE
jgi:hypothetical protein